MKRILILCAVCLAVLSCSKNNFCAVYNFNVENVESPLNEAKASFLPDHTILWQVGDEITFQIRLYDDASDEQIALYGGNQKVWEKEINGKLSYTDAGWKTYEEKGSSYKEVDSIELASKALSGYVTFRYKYEEPMVKLAGWFETVKFKEGPQTISVRVPGH